MSEQLQRLNASRGVAFRTDLSGIGQSGGSRIFGGGASANIIDEERRLIDKVFSIVDKDNSGSVDMEELKEMFKIFGVDTQHLTNAITRILSNTDKDFDGMISPAEFYQLLSQKFEKGDPKADIRAVFDRMDKDKSGTLDVSEMYEVSQMLGESIGKTEIKEMMKMFSSDYKKKHQDWEKAGKDPRREPQLEFLTFQDFYDVMQEDLV